MGKIEKEIKFSGDKKNPNILLKPYTNDKIHTIKQMGKGNQVDYIFCCGTSHIMDNFRCGNNNWL